MAIELSRTTATTHTIEHPVEPLLSSRRTLFLTRKRISCIDTFMDTEYFLLNDLAKLLNVQAYQIVYLLTTRQVEEPRRIGNRRVFTIWDAHRIGSGTTCKMAKELGRNFIGVDISNKYVELAKKRVNATAFVDVLLKPFEGTLASNLAGERQAALQTKLVALARSCRDYLAIGLQAAARADADRESLRKAVLNESVKATVIHDELRMVERRMHEGTRSAFEGLLFPRQAMVTGQIIKAMTTELPTWHGSLSMQARRSEAWMKDRLDFELTPLSQRSAPIGN